VDALEIEKGLRARGVELCRPAKKDAIETFANNVGVQLDPFVVSMYRTFNGFSNYDFNSQVLVWSLDQISSHRYLSKRTGGALCHPFGDLLIHSDFFMCDLQNHLAPCYLLEENSAIAPALDLFFVNLLAGQFDFVTPRA